MLNKRLLPLSNKRITPELLQEYYDATGLGSITDVMIDEKNTRACGLGVSYLYHHSKLPKSEWQLSCVTDIWGWIDKEYGEDYYWGFFGAFDGCILKSKELNEYYLKTSIYPNRYKLGIKDGIACRKAFIEVEEEVLV